MTGCQLAFAPAVAVVLAFLAQVAHAQSLPTAAEVQAGYRANYQQFPRPHITMRRTLRPSAEMRAWWQQQAQRMQKATTDPARSPKQREAAERALEEARRELENPAPDVVRLEDFWSDRTSWQLRIPFRDATGAPPADHVFPPEPLTTASLADAFRRHWVYTYSPQAKPTLNVWYGIPNPGAPAYGRRSDAILGDLPLEFQLPPLGAIAGPTAFLSHPIDTIFFRPGGTLRVLGYFTVDGRRALKVEHTWLTPSREPHRAPGELLTGDVITAWLDPEQGYLPLRAQWQRVLQLAGKQLNAEHQHIHQVLYTSKIERVPSAGFYPTEGIVELRSLDPDAGSLPEVDALAGGQKFNPPMITESQWLWRADTIDPQGASDPAIFRIPWPEGTEVFDEARLAGQQRQAPLPVGETAPPFSVTSWSDNKKRSLEDLRGQVIVLYFWIAWQPPCMAPLEVLETLQKGFANQKVTFLGIHVGNVEMAELRRAAVTAGVGFPQALDTGTDQTATSTLSRYRVRFYPTTLVIDRKGKVAWSSDSASTREQAAAAAKQAGIAFPFPMTMPPEEQMASWNRIYATMLTSVIERAVGQR